MGDRRTLVIAVVVGICLGIAARWIDDLAPRWVGNVGAVWFLTGFFIGRLERSLRKGARAGAICLVSATLAYYGWRVFFDGNISTRYLTEVGVFWLLAAAVTGVVSGALGAKSHRLLIPWAIAVGVLLGEALAVLLLSQRTEQVIVEVGAALGVAFLSKRRLTDLIPVATVTAVVVSVGVVLYREVLR